MKDFAKHTAAELKSFLSEDSNSIKVVSFDVFDTLLVRPFLKPTDLFAFISPRVEEVIGHSIDFRRERMNAEYETRLALPHHEDITIDEIYDHFLTLPPQHREVIKNLEIETERRLIYGKQSGRELFQIAKASGATLIAVSDMYLSRVFIEELLLREGYSFDRIYVSSEHRKVKVSGSMFNWVMEDLGVAPHEIVHIGDNPIYDGSAVARLGIGTRLVGLNRETMMAGWPHDLLWRKSSSDPSISAILGIIANRLFDKDASTFSYDKDSIFNGSSYNVGYYWLGPVLAAFSLQLIRNAQDRKRLYFLSRDGWIMKQVYDIIAPYFDSAPQSKYLYLSRKSTALAPIRSLEGMREKFGIVWFETTVGEWIKDRVGIEIEPGDDDLVRRFGFRDGLKSKINLKNCYKFQGVLLAISPRVLAKAKKQRGLLFEYLSQEGVARPHGEEGDTDEKLGFVDIGYHGQTPRNIFQLTGNYNINLYFLVAGKDIFSLVDEFGTRVYGSYGEARRGTKILDKKWKSFFRHHKIFETFFITTEGSVTGYSRDGDNKVIPQFYEMQFGREQEIAQDAHQGAVDFARDFTRIFGDQLQYLNPSVDVLMEPILLFANYTSSRDLDILQGAFFEDYFSGLALQDVEWPAGKLARRYPRLASLRNSVYFEIRRLYDIPSVGYLYDEGYGIALKIYRRIRRIFRYFFIFKRFLPRIF